MPGLEDPRTLLAAWERAAAVPPAARGSALLPGADRRLAAVAARAAAAYARTFGPTAQALVDCTACGETLELTVDVGAMASAAPPQEATTVARASGDLRVRALTVDDLLAGAAAAGSGDVTDGAAFTDDAAAVLLARTTSDRGGGAVEPGLLAAADLEAVDGAARELAGVAAATVVTVCPACGSDVREPVDVVALLWERVSSRAAALLGEVATLARAYGWTEPEVLDLSDVRRAAYLAMVLS